MHFAANALVGESMENPSKYFRNNVYGGLNLLDAMVAVGVKKFVFSSTCATFGPPDRVPIDETLPQRPINPYGESKLMFEKILRWYDEIHGLKFVALRYFNAAGATERYGEDHRIETHLIPNILKVALGQKENVQIFGTDYETPDGTCVRDYIHIVDLAQAHMLALGATDSAFLQSRHGRRHERPGDRGGLRAGQREENPRRRAAAAARRPGPAHRRIGQSAARTGLEAEIPGHRPDHRERLGLAPAESARLRTLAVLMPPFHLATFRVLQ